MRSHQAIKTALRLINSAKSMSYTIMRTDFDYQNYRRNMFSTNHEFEIYLEQSHENMDLPFIHLPDHTGVDSGEFVAVLVDNGVLLKLLNINCTTDLKLGPNIYDFTIDNRSSVTFPGDRKASITFNHDLEHVKDYTDRICVYWDVENSYWSSEGCELVSQDYSRDHTTCRCNHLTIFGVLFDVSGNVTSSLSLEARRILSIISWTFSIISLIGSLASFIILQISK